MPVMVARSKTAARKKQTRKMKQWCLAIPGKPEYRISGIKNWLTYIISLLIKELSLLLFSIVVTVDHYQEDHRTLTRENSGLLPNQILMLKIHHNLHLLKQERKEHS